MRREVRKSGGKEGEGERGGNDCEICFQKVIPPTLSASNPTLVSGVKSCHQSKGNRLTKLFFQNSMYVFQIKFFRIVF